MVVLTKKGWWRPVKELTGVRFTSIPEDGCWDYYNIELEFDHKYFITLKHQQCFEDEGLDSDNLANYFFKRINEEDIDGVDELTIAKILSDAGTEIPNKAPMLGKVRFPKIKYNEERISVR